MSDDPRRNLPKMNDILEHETLRDMPRDLVKHVARALLQEIRQESTGCTPADVYGRLRERLERLARPSLVPVINATGVVLHTNLGRAPWSAAAVASAADVASNYANAELDLSTGKRGERLQGVSRLLTQWTGAEEAIAVNNCAAAVLLSLTALARDQEVLISRSELVEIGGSFRVPDIIEAGGARLVEVGTTNRTRLADFERALTDRSAVLLRVHASNFELVGFTEETPLEQLVGLGRARGLAVVVDVGSGAMYGEAGEPDVREAVKAGADAVLFSGDKLIGGPQCGLCVGRREVIQRLRRHPLYRALRLDKVSLAALETTLRQHVMEENVPVRELMHLSADVLATRSQAFVAHAQHLGLHATVVDSEGRVGGGSMPSERLVSPAVQIGTPRPDHVKNRLRMGTQPVVCRVQNNALLIDLRTVFPRQEPALMDALVAAVTDESRP